MRPARPYDPALRGGYDFDDLFPDAVCRAAIAELNAWTSVGDIAAAARCLAAKPSAADKFDRRLILPFPDDDAFQAVVVKTIGWLIAAYQVPEPKIVLAEATEPELTPERRAKLKQVRFRPSGSIGPPGAIGSVAPALADRADQRFLLLEDEAYVIELLQTPLRCLMALIHKCATDTRKVAESKRRAGEGTGGEPTIYHKPYADSALPAIVEALCFYGYGLDFGPAFAEPGQSSVEAGYRAINVFGAPPVNAKFLELVQGMNAKFLDDLR